MSPFNNHSFTDGKSKGNLVQVVSREPNMDVDHDLQTTRAKPNLQRTSVWLMRAHDALRR